MVHDTTLCVESRLDWVTLTCHKPDKRERFLDLAHDIARTQAPNPAARRVWNWKGYGGEHASGVTFGRRDDSDILQLSQALADDYFDVAWARADCCTRIDLAFTVRMEGEISDRLREHYEQADAYRVASRPSLKVQKIDTNGRCETVYIGSRISDLFGRAYDKFAESAADDYKQTIRYEMEVKGDPAQRAAAACAASPNRANWISSNVQQYFTRRGFRFPLSCVDADVPINAIRPKSDDATRLAWLASSVRPAIQRLLATCSPEQIFDALGFPRTVSERARLRAAMELGSHTDWLEEWIDAKRRTTDAR